MPNRAKHWVKRPILTDFLLQTAAAKLQRPVQCPDMMRRCVGLNAREEALERGGRQQPDSATIPKKLAGSGTDHAPTSTTVTSRQVSPCCASLRRALAHRVLFFLRSGRFRQRTAHLPTRGMTGTQRLVDRSRADHGALESSRKKRAKHRAKPRFLDASTVLNTGLKAVQNGPSGRLKNFALR